MVEAGQVRKQDISDYLYLLTERKVSNPSRVCKLTALPPTSSIAKRPNWSGNRPPALSYRRKKVRTSLQPTAYKQFLAEAASGYDPNMW